ncbi:COX assembly mitochondrial protein homolog isoform X3 [Struthio camelus]|uniref:COX assembly mitochondrial protein homolog isoform X3 n=1 Tax=Struthio camelus TaxID=8801 RepID=UPI003603D553
MEPPPGTAENAKLRHVEKDVLIPQIMRERAKELCSDKVQAGGAYQMHQLRKKAEPHLTFHIIGFLWSAFTKCCKETGLLMVVKCRQENAALKDCLVSYYTDPAFYEECKTEYLKQRAEYRATGIKKKKQKLPSNV